jgi:hypothetical protein
MIIVGVPYSEPRLVAMTEITGGTPYGASTITGADGSRLPSENELASARFQGRHVAEIAARLSGQPTAWSSNDRTQSNAVRFKMLIIGEMIPASLAWRYSR